MNQNPAAGDRILELDALRGCAALGVIGLHLLQPIFFWAWSCVDLFFVLSGFLITSILLRNADAPRMLVAFYARRALRIWPVYYLTLAVVLVLFFVTGYTASGWPTLPGSQWQTLLFVQFTEQYLPGTQARDYIWYFDHSWSLAVEEQFYLLWPIAFLFVRPGLRLLLLGCVLAAAAAIWARHGGSLFYLLVTRIDGLLLGMLLAYITASGLLFRLPARVFAYIALFSLALLMPYLVSQGTLNLWGPAPRRAIEVTAFCLLYFTMAGAAIRWSGAGWLAPLRWRPLLHAGRLSFAIYMYQVPLAYIALYAAQAGVIPDAAVGPAVLITTLITAHASHVLIEQRVLRLKALFPYRPAGTGDGANSLSAPAAPPQSAR